MNQILITKNNDFINENFSSEIKSKKRAYLIVFFVSISICLIILFYFLCSYFVKLRQSKKTELIKNNYNVATLYSSKGNYDAIKLSNDISIIGLVEIPSISISYPILSDTNKELLKISVCRFSGPLPNRVGNLCIVGHNYKNNMMFSKINELNINDSIFITDLNNVKLEYIVYKKFKVKENDLNCTKNTNNTEITLITCNENNNSERTVIKAKVKD